MTSIKHHITSSLLYTLLLLLTSTSATGVDCSSTGKDFSIFPIYSKCSPFSPSSPPATLFNTVLTMAKKDPSRISYLLSQKSVVPVGPGQQILGTGNYVVRVKLGTPAQTMYMVMDTSSDSAWVPCDACTLCGKTTFSTANSTTYQSLDCSLAQCSQAHGQACTADAGPCVFNQSYGGDSSFSATLVQDSITLGADTVPSFTFGCANAISGGSIPPQGLLGLGRGSLSLLSQTVLLYQSTFSYCLPSFRSFYFSGSLKLGVAKQPAKIKFTPLLFSPRRSSLYFVNLTAISVGRKQLNVPAGSLDFNPTTGSGTIIDSGTVITRFVGPVYTALRDEFRSHLNGTISSLGAFDTCFDSSVNSITPTVTLRFTGMDLALPTENTLIHSSATSLACLAMAASPNNVNSVLNVIANLQQQNMRILFDVPNSRVGIARELCN